MPGDNELLGIVSSASIACGGHAGDDETMLRTVRAARDRGVAIGAHPGFADRENFGRRRLMLQPDELDAQVRGQVRRLVEIAEDVDAQVRYLKLHGALANMAAEEPAVAALCFASVTGLVDDLAILAIDNSAQAEVAETMGYPVVREAYADRAYLPNGLLVPRTEAGAVLHDPAAIAERAVRLARTGEIVAIDGSVIKTQSTSLCIHGDTAEAVVIARTVRRALEAEGIVISAPY